MKSLSTKLVLGSHFLTGNNNLHNSLLPHSMPISYESWHTNVGIVLKSKNGVQMNRALPLPLILADVAGRKPVDVSVFIQTSALLLFIYYISNFVVPQIISRKFDEDDDNS